MYNHLPTLCNHLLSFINKQSFEVILGQHQTDKRSKKFDTWKTFLGLFVWQVLNCSSSRELCWAFETHSSKLYHLWLYWVPRSTFSDRINKVPPIVFQTLFFHSLDEVKKVLSKQHQKDKVEHLYAIDSTLVSLTLSVFNRAYYRRKKWAIKLHTRLDLWLWVPDLVVISDGKLADSKASLDLIKWLWKGDVLLFDRWYLDYWWLYLLQQKDITFVTRTKTTTQYTPIEYFPIDHLQVQYDARVEFIHQDAKENYPETLRIVRYIDLETGKEYEFITNNFTLPAKSIADLYRQRREIETLFRWLKQNLKIKQFFGTSQNAVENQVWVALIYYLTVVLIKAKTRCRESLLELTRKFSCLLFERVNLLYIIWNDPKLLLKAIAPPPQGLFSLL